MSSTMFPQNRDQKLRNRDQPSQGNCRWK